MIYVYEVDGTVAQANKPPRDIVNYIEVVQVPDAPRESWRIVDGLLTFDESIKSTIEATEATSVAKAERDAALEALTYDFGDGRVMQTREKDKAKVDTAIELLELSGQPTVDWVMEDDIKYPTTAAELATALLAGKIGAAAIWSSYEP
tara:strand:+ start:943 stop:1386 length:444 start_codon:yes stop_codon:yes gene_type:complete